MTQFDDPKQIALRRRRQSAARKFAWLLRPGDAVHTPSEVFVVASVENGVENPRHPPSERTTVVTYDTGRTMRYKPQQELLVVRERST